MVIDSDNAGRLLILFSEPLNTFVYLLLNYKNNDVDTSCYEDIWGAGEERLEEHLSIT